MSVSAYSDSDERVFVGDIVTEGLVFAVSIEMRRLKRMQSMRVLPNRLYSLPFVDFRRILTACVQTIVTSVQLLNRLEAGLGSAHTV